MIIKTDEERVFVNLAVVDAVWSDASRRDHYIVGIGAHAFEVSRQVGDAILDALEQRESELDRIRRIVDGFDRVGQPASPFSRLRAILGAVLKQWSADTSGLADNQALWKEANDLLTNATINSPEQQVSS